MKTSCAPAYDLLEMEVLEGKQLTMASENTLPPGFQDMLALGLVEALRQQLRHQGWLNAVSVWRAPWQRLGTFARAVNRSWTRDEVYRQRRRRRFRDTRPASPRKSNLANQTALLRCSPSWGMFLAIFLRKRIGLLPLKILARIFVLLRR